MEKDYSAIHGIFRRYHNIAIGGRKGHGKDSLAMYLHLVYGYNITSFATPLKQKAAERLVSEAGLSLDEALRRLNHPKEKEQYRVLLQNIGMEEREADPLHWVKKSGIIQAQGLNVVPDARFENEVDAITRKPGISIFVRARWREQEQAEDPTLQHISEALGPESYTFTATVPRGIEPAINYYERFLSCLCFPAPDEARQEEFALWLAEKIAAGQR